MQHLRSILWIGPSEGLVESGASDSEVLDITWLRSAEEARPLALDYFDAAVLGQRQHSALLQQLRELRRIANFPPTLLCLQTASNAEMRELLAAGATDLLLGATGRENSELRDELVSRIHRLADASPWRGPRVPGKPTPAEQQGPVFPGVIGTSRAIREVFSLVKCATGSVATVLLSGETGSGKEVIARAIHSAGLRSAAPFIAVNCAAFPETLLEGELFGHTKGAFTGAERDKRGLFEAADGGTLFLDEIGETTPAFQAKLLRALQEREIRPVGSTRARSVDVRVIAATNRNLRAEAREGRFREDLFYRLAVFPISVPSLRQRTDDILPLAAHFVELHQQREGKGGCQLSHSTGVYLRAHHWPGNVRELENAMQRALALTPAGGFITPEMLPDTVTRRGTLVEQSTRAGETLRESMARIEAFLIERALERNGGRRMRTAEQLGVTREGLYKKMKRLEIE